MAWHVLGWEPAFFSEIEKFPSAALAHHYPHVPNLGDMTKFQEWGDHAIDLLVGGTPCQSFSVAGLRAGLADPRGNLMLTYLAIAARYRPRWLVWENVPGVLSSNGGRDFGTLLRGLGELGYGFAYRVLDAQFCRAHGYEWAVPQRRRRVFVVGYLGDWRRAAAVLFDGTSLRGDPPPRREAGQRVAPTISSRPTGGGGLGTDCDLDGGLVHAFGGNNTAGPIDVATAVNAHGVPHGRQDFESETFVTEPIVLMERGRSDGPNLETRQDGTANAILTPNGGRGGLGVGAVAYGIQAGATRENPSSGPDGVGIQSDIAYTVEARAEVQAVAFQSKASSANSMNPSEIAPTLDKGKSDGMAVAWSIMPQNSGKDYKARAVDVAQPIMAGGPVGGNQGGDYIQQAWAVRRLIPRECERLQGFPEFLDRVRIEVWHSSDLRQTSAPAGTQNPRSPKSASIVGGSASARPANPAATVSSTSRPGHDLPVALNVLIDLERGEVQFHRAGRLIWSANTAEKPSASPLSMPLDAFVRLAAHMTQTAVPQTLHGRVELPQSINSSSPALLGSACVSASGQEIEELASDAAKFGTAVESCMKFTTSPSGHNSQTCDLSLRTLSSCVTAAISSCIPSETRQANSYAVTVDLIRSFTAVPYRGKPAADGPRYKALGNSMAVNVMRVIGTRIAMVDARPVDERAVA